MIHMSSSYVLLGRQCAALALLGSRRSITSAAPRGEGSLFPQRLTTMPALADSGRLGNPATLTGFKLFDAQICSVQGVCA